MAVSMPTDPESRLQRRVRELGRLLLAELQRPTLRGGPGGRWLDRFLERMMEHPRFRVQALRFIDVLPTLDDDGDLVRHLREYFGHEDLPLTGLMRAGIRYARGGVAPLLVARGVRRGFNRLARRFIGGSSAEEAAESVRLLWEQGRASSLDLLGEATVSEEEADEYRDRYLELLNLLPARAAAWPGHPDLERRGLPPWPRVHLSLKLSSLASQFNHLDPDGTAARVASRLRPILIKAKERGAAVCVDMEQYDLKGPVLHCIQSLLMEPELRRWDGAGIALQAYLRDCEADLSSLAAWAERRGSPLTVRLVRGAYWDYEATVARQQGWPLPVWSSKAETDACYERCLRFLFDVHALLQPAVATHNLRSLALAMALAEERGMDPCGFEFQMLHGMGAGLQRLLPARGYRLRIYLPFGELLPGMAYLVRRLLENASSQSFQRLTLGREPAAEALLAPPRPDSAPQGESLEPPGFRNEPLRRFTEARERQGFRAAIDRLRAELGRTWPLIIDGQVLDSGRYIESFNPACPGERLGRVAAADETLAERALSGAWAAFPAWAARSAEDRVAILRRAAALLRERRDDFAALEILEAGKTWPEADANVTETIDYLEYYAREALRLALSRRHELPGEENETFYVPRGVGVVLPPWNFPLAILTGMLSAALVCGNAVILKPSSQTPVIAARMVELLGEAGVPPGVLQFLPGPGAEVGEYLARHPQIRFIAFTGSREVGTRLIRQAAQLQPGQQYVKHVIAEMGGKNAVIVDSDADPDEAVTQVLRSAFGYQGQKCSACSRVIVVGGRYPRYLERLVQATRSLPMGPPEDPGSVMGPVIDGAARERIQRIIDASGTTARLVLQVQAPERDGGYYLGPVIFADVDPDSALAQEEIFGPVLAVMPARDLDQALAIANHSCYALTGGLLSRSPGNIQRVRREFHVGNLYINRAITGALVERQPFGGFKLSGLGSKAGGPDYLLHFVLPRTVTENTLRRGFAPDVLPGCSS